MTKTKTARLSLTMPGPIDASQEPVRPVATNPVQKSNSPSGMRRPNERPSDPKRNGEARSRDIYAKSSSPPRYQTSSTSDRPRSPTTPTSPSFNSSHTFSASTEPSSRHIREQSRSFFANLKASKSSAKIQPPEPTIRKVPQEGSTSEENLKRPNRTKSTPDLRGANSSEPVPDLPSLDSNPPPSKENLQSLISRLTERCR